MFYASQCLPRRPLRRVPGRAFPPGARRARGRVLHPGRGERRASASLIVLGELDIVAPAVHAYSHVVARESKNATRPASVCRAHVLRVTDVARRAYCREDATDATELVLVGVAKATKIRSR